MLHKYLEHFKAIAETSSMMKASEMLHISQPSLSRSVKILEDILNIQLFERKNKGVVITEYGNVLYNQVCAMGNEFSYAMQEINYLKNQLVKKISIGSGLTWQYGVFPDIVKQYTDRFPETQMITITGNSHTVYNLLLKGQFDIAFCDISSLQPMTGIIQEHLLNVYFSYFANWNHPIFKNKNIREDMLEKYDFAIFSHSNQILEMDIADDNMISVSARRRIKYISGSMINLLEVVSTSEYLTALPFSIHRIAEQFGLKEIHNNMRRKTFPSGMVYHKSAINKPHIKALIDAVKSSIN